MRSELIRDYENAKLPLERRLPSLAKRFPCLVGAEGLEPWTPERFYSWLQTQKQNASSWHAGLLVLNLQGKGPWEPFDVVDAIEHFDDANRVVFATWAISWR